MKSRAVHIFGWTVGGYLSLFLPRSSSESLGSKSNGTSGDGGWVGDKGHGEGDKGRGEGDKGCGEGNRVQGVAGQC